MTKFQFSELSASVRLDTTRSCRLSVCNQRFGSDPLEPFTTGSFPAFQLNLRQKPFVAFGIVPLAEVREAPVNCLKPEFREHVDRTLRRLP